MIRQEWNVFPEHTGWPDWVLDFTVYKRQRSERIKKCLYTQDNHLQIKQVSSNETVGYGRKEKLERDAQIATIRFGYADGLDRQFGNRKGRVLINGYYAPIVGNVCMDLCMVDVTDIPAREGDTVVLFGEGLSVVDLAESIGTIPYEILTSVSPRVKRVYIKE